MWKEGRTPPFKGRETNQWVGGEGRAGSITTAEVIWEANVIHPFTGTLTRRQTKTEHWEELML